MKKDDNSARCFASDGDCSKLAACKLGNLISNATTDFCDKYIDRQNRIYDQMVRSAQTGAAGVAACFETTDANRDFAADAKASLKKLLDDYRSFLQQNNLALWSNQSAEIQIIRDARPETAAQLRQLMAALAVSSCPDNSDGVSKISVQQETAANTMICLIDRELSLLGIFRN